MKKRGPKMLSRIVKMAFAYLHRHKRAGIERSTRVANRNIKKGAAIAAMLLLFLVIGCGPSERTPAVFTTKVVASKHQAVEQRVGVDWWDSQNMIRSRAETIYYLVYEDGCIEEVTMRTWVDAKPGDEHSSNHWHCK